MCVHLLYSTQYVCIELQYSYIKLISLTSCDSSNDLALESANKLSIVLDVL